MKAVTEGRFKEAEGRNKEAFYHGFRGRGFRKPSMVEDFICSNENLVNPITLERVMQGSDTAITEALMQIHHRSLPRKEKMKISNFKQSSSSIPHVEVSKAYSWYEVEGGKPQRMEILEDILEDNGNKDFV